MADSFPRRHAQTRGFNLGAPRSFSVSDDGGHVAFLRSTAGDDPINRLWMLDVATGLERMIADPVRLLTDPGEESLPAAEKARRERARESGGGIVAYSGDRNLNRIVFTLGGQVFLVEVGNGEGSYSVRSLPVQPGAFDPRLSPDGRLVAYVCGTGLRVVDTAPDGRDRLIIQDLSETVSWGSAEFIAAEEMGRSRGFWWSPDSLRLLAARVDTAPVPTWHISSPEDPATAPVPKAYPAAGTTNAEVTLAILGLDGSQIDVGWDRDAYEYLARAGWNPRSRPVITVQSRDQRTAQILKVDPETGHTTELARQTDSHWVELVEGAPAWMGDRLVTVEDQGSARRMLIDGHAVTPDHLQVRWVITADENQVVLVATDDPTEAHIWRVTADGRIERLTNQPGVHSAAAGAGTTVIARAAWADPEATFEVIAPGTRIAITSLADRPSLTPAPVLAATGSRELRTAVLYPSNDAGIDGAPLPVLLDPYGGPHALRVLKARSTYLVSQWFADQGFAVVVTDGRGTPARGPDWERAVFGDLAHPVLDDQVDALDSLAEHHPRLDLDRVAVRGWSFGGYLAALAVLARPDRFHAAIAGAPVTDWRLYDTHYTERYLGHPDNHPEAYSRTSLLERAGDLTRPLLLICGLADDNVFAAHTLQLSAALFEAGRPHQVLPLPGITHMTPQEHVAENLLLLQRAFLFDSLGLHPPK